MACAIVFHTRALCSAHRIHLRISAVNTRAFIMCVNQRPPVLEIVEKQILKEVRSVTCLNVHIQCITLSPRFFAKNNIKFCIQNAKFCKLKRQILQKFCNVFPQPNFFLCNANTAVTHTKPYIFLIKCILLKNNTISIMEVDL